MENHAQFQKYAGARISKLALAALALGLLGVLTSALLIPAIVAIVLGAAARQRILWRPELAGAPLATWAIKLGVIGLAVGMMVDGFLLPPITHGGIGYRSACAANLRGMVQSMAVYAADNQDVFPTVAYAPYSAALNNAHGLPAAGTAEDTLKLYTTNPPAQAGSVPACAWILVLNGQVAPKGFLCKSDPFLRDPAKQQDDAGRWYDNFQDGAQLSYSLAYPWNADGKIGPWWKNTSDSSVPIAADMAPMEGTGTPPRTLTAPMDPATPAAHNSANHSGQGQNVAFADSHVEFFRRPDIGEKNDNIYTTSAAVSSGPSPTGVAATLKGPTLTATTQPFDIVLYPIRDAATGGM